MIKFLPFLAPALLLILVSAEAAGSASACALGVSFGFESTNCENESYRNALQCQLAALFVPGVQYPDCSQYAFVGYGSPQQQCGDTPFTTQRNTPHVHLQCTAPLCNLYLHRANTMRFSTGIPCFVSFSTLANITRWEPALEAAVQAAIGAGTNLANLTISAMEP